MKPKSKGLYVSHLKKIKENTSLELLDKIDGLMGEIVYLEGENKESFWDGVAIGALFTAIVGLILWALIIIK